MRGNMKTAEQIEEQVALARDAVRIEPMAIDEEFARLPGDLAYWNAHYADALRAHLIAKAEFERELAGIAIITRETLGIVGGKVTESMVEEAVNYNPKTYALRLVVIDAEVEKVRLGGIVDAVRSKRDMLISLGANLRAEMQGDPSLREEARSTRIRGR